MKVTRLEWTCTVNHWMPGKTSKLSAKTLPISVVITRWSWLSPKLLTSKHRNWQVPGPMSTQSIFTTLQIHLAHKTHRPKITLQYKTNMGYINWNSHKSNRVVTGNMMKSNFLRDKAGDLTHTVALHGIRLVDRNQHLLLAKGTCSNRGRN